MLVNIVIFFLIIYTVIIKSQFIISICNVKPNLQKLTYSLYMLNGLKYKVRFKEKPKI